MNAPLYQAILSAPGFSIGLRCHNGEVTGIDYLPSNPEQAPQTPLAQEAVRQLRAYLNDPAVPFDLPLAPVGTPFQRQVWQHIATIPHGQTISYGELAKSIQSAPRAVGGACGANPYPIVVPCHRVVAAGGRIGGFGRQREGLLLDIKRWLLAHEHEPSN